MKQLRDRSTEQDDATLVARVLAGQRDTFDILFQRYASSVQHLCTTLLGTSVEAQDIAQEAALQAFLGLSRLVSCDYGQPGALSAASSQRVLFGDVERREHDTPALDRYSPDHGGVSDRERFTSVLAK